MKKKHIIAVLTVIGLLLGAIVGYEYYAQEQQRKIDEWHLSAGLAYALDSYAQDFKQKEMTRVLAAAILNRHYAAEPKSRQLTKLHFKPERVQAAIEDGIIEQSPKFPRPWVLGSAAWKLTEHVKLHQELPPTLMGKPATVHFIEPHNVDIRTIDGFTEARAGGGIKVDYTVRLSLDKAAEEAFSRYFYISVSRSALLRFYDDGWRVVYAKSSEE